MCGIVGLQYLDGERRVNPADLEAMNRQIVHRGPDDAGAEIFGSFGMAMRRLSIIDVSSGHQPISNEDETVWVVCNGEIYNFREIADELRSKGHVFKTGSDTEVLVHLYEEEGDDFVGRLNGMYAFALWDKKQGKLILGRDRVGIKPLYYFNDGRLLAFASEMKALFALDEIPREIDKSALDEFLTLEYVLSPRTLTRGVHKLEPGHILVSHRGHVTSQRYWTPTVSTRKWTTPDAIKAVRETLKEAVRRHMIADVPLGAFLSGGIDSSIIVGLMTELSSRPVKTFSIGFDDATYNELSYSKLVAQRFGTDHEEHMLRIDPQTFLSDFIRYMDEPIGDVSIIPTYLVSKAARRQVTVALSGDGGDELFGGYDAYMANRMDALLSRVMPHGGMDRIRVFLQSLAPTEKKKGLINKMKRFTEGAALSPGIQHYRWMTFLNEDLRSHLYSPAVKSELSADQCVERLERYFADVKDADAVNQQMYVDLNVYLPEDILAKVDVASMANSLEVRVPFLDREVLDLSLSLPGDLKIHGFQRKYILKKAFADLLPSEIINRKKEGFSIPMKNWLRHELKDSLFEILNPRMVKQSGLFEWSGVNRLVMEHLKGTHNHAHQLWCLMVFHLWYAKFFKKPTGVVHDVEKDAVCH